MLESLAIQASQQSDSQLSPSEMPSRFWGRLSSSSGPSPSPTRSTLSMLPGGLQLRQKVACLLINLKIWQTSGHTSRLGRRSGSRLTDACKPSSAAQVACGSYHPMEKSRRVYCPALCNAAADSASPADLISAAPCNATHVG